MLSAFPFYLIKILLSYKQFDFNRDIEIFVMQIEGFMKCFFNFIILIPELQKSILNLRFSLKTNYEVFSTIPESFSEETNYCFYYPAKFPSARIILTVKC